MATTILLLLCAPYAAVAVGYLEARRRDERPPRWARILGILTVVVHLAALTLLSRQTGRSPFQTESQALSFLAFALAALYAVLEATSGVATYGGGFYLLTAILAAGGVPGLAEERCLFAPRPPDFVRSFHVGFALLGTAAIVAGGLLAIGYLGVYRRVKTRELALEGQDGPSLFGLQRLARDASFAGLALLGPSLILGWVVLARTPGHDPWAVAEMALSAFQAALVLSAWFLWWRRPLRGAIAAWLNVVATAVAVITLALVHPHLAAVVAGPG